MHNTIIKIKRIPKVFSLLTVKKVSKKRVSSYFSSFSILKNRLANYFGGHVLLFISPPPCPCPAFTVSHLAGGLPQSFV
jgi:hypothetical protein